MGLPAVYNYENNKEIRVVITMMLGLVEVALAPL